LEPTFIYRIAYPAGSLEGGMSRYFFDVKNGHRLDHEARDQAVLIARQIAMDAPASEGRHVAVLNSDREEVGKVPINARSKEEDHGNEQIGRRQKAQG
jgi:hypothetical protein